MKSNQKKYLDRVTEIIVRETRIDYDMGEIQFPFFPFLLFSSSPASLIYRSFFTKHCKDTYGLGEEETDYVWDQYRDIIKDKLTTK